MHLEEHEELECQDSGKELSVKAFSDKTCPCL